MKKFKLPINNNPLKSRKDLQEAFNQMCNPLKSFYSKGCAHLHVGNTSAAYSDAVAEMEGFSRVLWGLAPLTAGGKDSELWDIYLQGIKNGTNPQHEEYWGDITDYDQKMVETAALGVALALVPEKIWNPLSDEEKNHFASWLYKMNEHKAWECNWLLFCVLVNIGLKKVGAPYSQEMMDINLKKVDEFYLSDGWYSDGKGGHSDYYVPFAIHYYGLLYAKLMEKDDPERSKLYKDRAREFAKDFIYWFAGDGSAIPYGRSLTYRFAQSAFWSALAYANVEVFSWGVMKGIILRNLRWWFSKPIFNADGTLTIGYAYPNLVMGENYNSPGSPYWALKTFLPLALREDHPFWTSEEELMPRLNEASVQKPPHLVICRQDEKNHVLAFNSGHLSTNEHTHTSAKYEKFVYSNFFGFSVPRAEWGIGQGAFDSMLALSEGDNIYRVKRYCEEYSIDDNVIFSRWKPWKDVEIKTWIITGAPWHIRIHHIDTERILDTAEGGFALGLESDEFAQEKCDITGSENAALAKLSSGISGIVNLYGCRQAKCVFPNSDTNLINPRTVIPTITGKLNPGKHYLVSAVLGQPGEDADNYLWNHSPQLEFKENKITILSNDLKNVLFELKLNSFNS